MLLPFASSVAAVVAAAAIIVGVVVGVGCCAGGATSLSIQLASTRNKRIGAVASALGS